MEKRLFYKKKEVRLPDLHRYLLFFSCAVIAATLPLGVSYYATLKSLEKNIEQINQTAARQICELYQERLNEINNVIQQAGNNHLTYFILNLDGKWADAQPGDIITAQQYQEYLQGLKLPSDLILDIAVYSESSRLVFKYNGALPFDSWYESSFAGEYLSPNDWLKRSSNSRQGQLMPGCIYYTMGIPLKAIPYVQKFPLGSQKQLTGHIAILLDRDKLLSGLVRSDTFESLWVLDEQDTLLASWGTREMQENGFPFPAVFPKGEYGSYMERLEGSPYLVTFAQSGDGLNFVTAAPYSKVFGPAQTMKTIFFVMLMVCLISLTASCFTFAKKISHPMKRLISDNDQLLSQLANQKSEMRISIISRLLTGCFGTREEILSSLESVDISWESCHWCAVCMRITEDVSLCGATFHQPSDYLLIKARIRTLIQKGQGSPSHEAPFSQLFVIDTGIDCLTFIWGTEHYAKGEEWLRMHVSGLIHEIQEFLLPFHIYIPAGGGGFYSDMTELHISYEEALFALKNRMPESLKGLLWHRAQTSVPAFFYPAELEQRILISTKCGDRQGLEEALSYIHRENYEMEPVSEAARELLELRLKTTLLTVCGEISCPDQSLAQEISSFVFHKANSVPGKQTLKQLQDFFFSLCQLAGDAQTEKQKSLQLRLLEFVDENSFDSNMSLTMAADAFSMSENYISAFFKDQTGVNFLSYVENKRLQRSCQLLSQTEETIDSIAFTVGYTSAHSFRRAFKRKMGVSPAKYREETQQDKTQ